MESLEEYVRKLEAVAAAARALRALARDVWPMPKEQWNALADALDALDVEAGLVIDEASAGNVGEVNTWEGKKFDIHGEVERRR